MPDPALTPRSDVAAAWRAAYDDGRRAHPDLDVPFASFLGRRVGAPLPCATGDYYLARACEGGSDGAWARVQHTLERPLRAFLRRRGASRDDAEALLEEGWGALAAPPPSGGARTVVGTYDGRGSLQAFVATVLWRRLCDRWRAKAAAPPSGPAPETVPCDDDPVRRLADAETARVVGDALEDAWPRLTAKELQAVVLKYRHAMPQQAIASALRVGAPRVTRLLQSAARRLRDAVAARLSDVPAVGGDGDAWAALRGAVARILARTDVDGAAAPAQRRSNDG